MYKLFLIPLTFIIFYLFPVAYGQEIVFKSGNNQVALIELYTSQGCSSCPPADEWLAELKNKPGLWNEFVPVAFHVDYWDFLGWKDSFSKEEFSNRQRLHRAQGNVKVVYTPGFFLNGNEWRSRFGRSIPSLGKNTGAIHATLNDNRLYVEYSSTKPLSSATLNVGVLGFGYQTPIKAGENSNRVLHEDFVLLSHSKHISTTQNWKITLPEKVMPSAKKYGIAIWISAGANLKPLQSTGGWLPDNYY